MAQIAEKMKLMPRVDFNGRDLPPATADPSVITIVDAAAPAAPPSMATALTEVAAACGADLAVLVDSTSFTAEIARISPSEPQR